MRAVTIINIKLMDRTMIIYAHPNKQGFCGELLACVIRELDIRNEIYDLVDLYEIHYDPVMKNEEHYTSGGYEISEENKEFQNMITDATHLIFIYPTWWQNMPAILKGFADRVFVSRFAFRYIHNLPFGLLKGRRAVVLTSAGGPRIYSYLIIGDRAMKVMVKDVLRFCGMRAKGFGVGGARTLDERAKKRVHRTVHKAMQYLYKKPLF
jgi:NAD(P)H dehydrogenase (quinone)